MNATTPTGFAGLGLAESFVQALARAEIENPTPVQSRAIPAALDGADLLVSSQTGSGKTLAFMLPSLQRLQAQPRCDIPQILVLTPTRELAQQVADVAISFGGGQHGPRIVTLVGGAPYGPQLRMLRSRVDIVVATPGRLLDHLNSGRLDLSAVQTLILDEADRMLDMGFEEDLEAILACIPDERQTLLFSATLDGEVAHLAQNYTRNPQRIEIARTAEGQPQIEQLLFYANNQEHKQEILTSLLATFMEEESLQQGVIFTATKRSAEELSEILKEHGFNTKALHGDMNQGARTRALGGLRKGHTQLLIATDVAARGLDVSTISHVFNYDLPNQAENYVHRIGRTGRAGRAGLAISLAHVRERGRVLGIQRFTGQDMEECVIEGLEPTLASRPKKPAQKKGRPHQNAPRGGFHPRDHEAHPPRRERSDAPRRERSAHEGRPHEAGRAEPRGRTGYGEWRDRPPQGGRSDRPPQRERSERAPYEGRREHAPRGDRPERASFGDRPHGNSFGDRRERPSFEGRPGHAPRGDRPERAPHGAGRSERAPHEGRREHAPRGDRPERSGNGERRERSPQGGRSDRASFGDRRHGGFAERRDRPSFEGRSEHAPRGDRPERSPRAGYAERPQRQERSDRPQRAERPQRQERTDRPAHADKPRLSVNKGPRKGTGKAALQQAGKKGGHQRPKRATR